jgi:hypothetical protein
MNIGSNNNDVGMGSCIVSDMPDMKNDILVQSIMSTVNDNYICIGMLLLTMTIAGAIVTYVCKSITELYLQWRRLSKGALIVSRANSDSIDDIPSPKDDVDDLPIVSSVHVARKRLAKLGTKYKSYNEAMKRYALARGELPDDLIDNRVLSRDYDNYKYDSRARVGGSRRVITDPNRPWIERTKK